MWWICGSCVLWLTESDKVHLYVSVRTRQRVRSDCEASTTNSGFSGEIKPDTMLRNPSVGRLRGRAGSGDTLVNVVGEHWAFPTDSCKFVVVHFERAGFSALCSHRTPSRQRR
ncbi:hypothetical protein C8Q78DRAFT_504525 [Trametes maxima]|nr:hypothetical protein C8Q78DRAFT_504525 [Trametes maxima]